MSRRGSTAKIIIFMSAKGTFQKVQRFIKTESLLDKAVGVVIALSGGPDSIALLDIFVRLQKALGKNKRHPQEIKLHIAHLNHKLRGKEADADAEFVKQVAENLAIPATIEAIDIDRLAKKSGKGIEEMAREARYQFLLDTAIKTGCNRMATGHTMSDQAETFLLRLTRGAGLRGLASMRSIIAAHQFNKKLGVGSWESGVGEENSGFRIRDTTWIEKDDPQSERPTAYGLRPSEIQLIRPLLCITREEVEAYCFRRKLRYCVDATNQSSAYTRNRIRHEVLQRLGEINPRVVEQLAQTAEIIAADQDALDELASRFLEKARHSLTPWHGDENNSVYSVKAILEHPLGVQRRMLLKAISWAREDLLMRNAQLSEIETAHVKAVARLLEAGASGKRVILGDGLEVWREFEALIFTSPSASERPSSPKQESFADQSGREGVGKYFINQKDQAVEFGEFRLSIKREQNGSLLNAVISQTQHEKNRTGMDWLAVGLDDTTLTETLIIRTRQAGEKVLVMGQQKIKKLKNLMIDHKIASSRRATWPVVATSDGQYVWSPGLPPAVKFAAHGKIKQLAIIRASNL